MIQATVQMDGISRLFDKGDVVRELRPQYKYHLAFLETIGNDRVLNVVIKVNYI